MKIEIWQGNEYKYCRKFFIKIISVLSLYHHHLLCTHMHG